MLFPLRSHRSRRGGGWLAACLAYPSCLPGTSLLRHHPWPTARGGRKGGRVP